MLAVATVLSTVAALGALRYAYLTVRETRATRAEERHDRELRRLYHVLDLVGEVATATAQGGHTASSVARLRLAPAVSGDRTLRECKVLAESGDDDPFEQYLTAQEEVWRSIEALRDQPALGR